MSKELYLMYPMRPIRNIFSGGLLILIFLLCSCGASTSATPAPSKVVRKTVPTAHASPTVPVTSMPSVATPARLLIPVIGVNAPVENLGILSNGDLNTPQQSPWEDVGWYKMGPRPGEVGSAVIDGHLDRPGGYPAVFWNLRHLKRGDSVMVVDASGKTTRFRVTDVAMYPPQEAPLQEIFANTGGTYLNLITCAGDWIPSEHQTTLRLVVYTTLA